MCLLFACLKLLLKSLNQLGSENRNNKSTEHGQVSKQAQTLETKNNNNNKRATTGNPPYLYSRPPTPTPTCMRAVEIHSGRDD